MSVVRRQLTGSRADTSVRRELVALATFLDECSRTRAARRMGIRPLTLAHYLGSLYRELDVSGQFASIAAARRLGWLRVPPEYLP